MGRGLQLALAIVVAVALALLLRAAKQFEARNLGAAEPNRMGDLTARVQNADILSRTRGTLNWKLHADRIDLRNSGAGDLESFRSALFTGVNRGVLFRDGKPEIRFSAAAADYDNLARRFDITGPVRLRSAHGDLVESQRCQWSEVDDFIQFPSGARATVDRQAITAPVLLFSPRRRVLQCPSGAEGTLNGYRLHAGSLYWDMAARKVNCPGGVSGERGDITLTAGDAMFDLRARTLSANRGTARIRIESGLGEPR